MAAELKVDLRTVVEWGDKWLVTFNSSKTKLLSINRFNPFMPDCNLREQIRCISAAYEFVHVSYHQA